MTKKAFEYFFYMLAALMFNAAFVNVDVQSVASVCDEVCVELSAGNNFGLDKQN